MTKISAEVFGVSADLIEKKLCHKIIDYSGDRTQWISDAEEVMRKKLEELRQKQIDFSTLSKNLDIFHENCKIADKNVANAINTLTVDYMKDYGLYEDIYSYADIFAIDFASIGKAIGDLGTWVGEKISSVEECIEDLLKEGVFLVKAALELAAGIVTALVLIKTLPITITILGFAMTTLATKYVLDGISSAFNELLAYDKYTQGDIDAATKYSNTNTFTDTIRNELGLYNAATNIDFINLTAGSILTVDIGFSIGQGLKNVVTKMKNGGVKGTKNIGEIANIGKSAEVEGVSNPKNINIEEVIPPGAQKPVKVYTDGNAQVNKGKIETYIRGKIQKPSNYDELKNRISELTKLKKKNPSEFSIEMGKELKAADKLVHNYERSKAMGELLDDAGIADTTENNENSSYDSRHNK